MPPRPSSVLALDVGAKRVGVAIASLEARLPRPFTTLEQGDDFMPSLKNILETEGVTTIIVGLPRGLQGQATDQTSAVEDFAKELQENFTVPVAFQDEAVTSKQAEAELEARGKPYNRGDIDALAATYILEDWLEEQRGQAYDVT